MANNIIRFSGYGWGQQRHNTYTPASIKGWGYENTAYNFTIHDNIFDRAAYRMLHLVAKKKESCPLMYNNTYINKLGQTLGQYGSNEVEEPANHSYDERVEEIITNIFGDKDSKVYFMDGCNLNHTLAPRDSYYDEEMFGDCKFNDYFYNLALLIILSFLFHTQLIYQVQHI